MKFRVTRTSSSCMEKPPVPGCVKEMGRVEYMLGGELKSREREDWYVTINSLEELLAFQKEAKNEIIISDDGFYGDGYTLEIYDGYRE